MEFQTLPTANPHRPARLDLGQKAIYECRLANPRLAREKHHLALALLRPREGRVQTSQFLLASDEVECRGWRVLGDGRGESRALPICIKLTKEWCLTL